jgi:hypothetical protein
LSLFVLPVLYLRIETRRSIPPNERQPKITHEISTMSKTQCKWSSVAGAADGALFGVSCADSR